ncbi:YggT family protein [Candidatus Dojkabacteria bacterium]|uniref:YggT family protein n=1 Tax=Candidatus Dojkabacteria bacterium TaxID=2099670 RepID=A0A955L7K0_9BACT|nr:YggT family protein [Candidatus Dojkabacteria bacterium]
MAQSRKPFEKFRNILYSILGIVVTFIVIRAFLKLIGANEASMFVNLWYEFTDVLIQPWVGMFPDIRLGSRSVIDISSVIGAMFYVIIAVVFEVGSEELESSTTEKLLYSLGNGIFKVIEFVLALRFALKLFNASTSSSFVRFIYAISDIVHDPFIGIVKDFQYEGVVIEFTTAIAFIIILLLDVAFDGVLRALFDRRKLR